MTDSWTDPWNERAKEDPGVSPLNAPVIGVPVAPEVQRDIERREALRQEELTHLTELRDRVQKGINNGAIDLESGATLLLNISKARMALAGVGYYPGAW